MVGQFFGSGGSAHYCNATVILFIAFHSYIIQSATITRNILFYNLIIYKHIFYTWKLFCKINCIVYLSIIYIITMFWPNVCVKSAKCLDHTVTRQIERVEKRWTPFINVFGHHMLHVCVVFPFSSSLERPYGLYTRAVCSQGIEIYVRHMVHDIRCMNACEYLYNNIYFLPWKKIVYPLGVILFFTFLLISHVLLLYYGRKPMSETYVYKIKSDYFDAKHVLINISVFENIFLFNLKPSFLNEFAKKSSLCFSLFF